MTLSRSYPRLMKKKRNGWLSHTKRSNKTKFTLVDSIQLPKTTSNYKILALSMSIMKTIPLWPTAPKIVKLTA